MEEGGGHIPLKPPRDLAATAEINIFRPNFS